MKIEIQKMKRIIYLFIIISLIKGGLLFITILTGDWFPSIPILLRYLLFFVLIWFVDTYSLKRLVSIIKKIHWIVMTVFLFGSYVMILFTTGPLFILYYWLLNFEPENYVEMPKPALIGFLIIGLIISFINSIIAFKKNKQPDIA